MSASFNRSDALAPASFTDRDRRWLVHVFAALQQGIQDELEHDSLLFHDASLFADSDRFHRLWTYAHDELTRCMERTHAEEALFVGGLQELEGTAMGPNLDPSA